jgi:hypothetical protein
MFCWGCSIPELYAPVVDLMDFIDGEHCNCDTSPTDLRSESGNVNHASDRDIAKTVRSALHEEPRGRTALLTSLILFSPPAIIFH